MSISTNHVGGKCIVKYLDNLKSDISEPDF